MRLIGLPMLCALGLLAGGCSLHGPGMSAYAGPGPGYHHMMVDEDEGPVPPEGYPPVGEVLPAPMYGYHGGGYYRREVRYGRRVVRSGPICPGGMHFSSRWRKCVAGEGKDITSPKAKAALAGCDGGHVQVRYMLRGGEVIQQQRAVGCHRIEQNP